MTTITKCLVETKYLEASETTQYTAPTGTRTIIDKVTAFSAAGGSVTLRAVPNGDTAGASNQMVAKTLAANESYTFPELVGHTLNSGDFISGAAGGANTVVIRISGREVT